MTDLEKLKELVKDLQLSMDLYDDNYSEDIVLLRDAIAEIEELRAEHEFQRNNPAWETEAFLGGLSPEEYDVALAKAMNEQR